MPTLVLALVALLGAAIHSSRHRDDARPARRTELFLVWWLAVAVGVGSVITALAHLFNGPATAALIGYTRGDGGFQFENAMGDLAIGVVGIMCIRFRGSFWLATLTVMSIVYLGDAGGHLYYWIAQNNTKSGNVGAPLWLDVVQPVVGWALYAALRARARSREPSDAVERRQSPPPHASAEPTAHAGTANHGPAEQP